MLKCKEFLIGYNSILYLYPIKTYMNSHILHTSGSSAPRHLMCFRLNRFRSYTLYITQWCISKCHQSS